MTSTSFWSVSTTVRGCVIVRAASLDLALDARTILAPAYRVGGLVRLPRREARTLVRTSTFAWSLRVTGASTQEIRDLLAAVEAQAHHAVQVITGEALMGPVDA